MMTGPMTLSATGMPVIVLSALPWAQAGVPVIKLHEGGRHTGNSLMRDAGVDREVRMREVGHAGRDINDRYTHVLIEAPLAAADYAQRIVSPPI